MNQACYCIPFRTAARKVSALYNQALEPVGVNIAQFSMLRKIRKAKEISITELGKVCELDRSTAGRNVRVLEKMGLVQFIKGEDHRETTVSLSENGHQTLEDGELLWEKSQVEVENKLGGPEKAQDFLELLKSL
ncbi:MarR family winged helix-turn-helix transcriptional regulator [Cytobacillus purgationiresistens]|uniref:DNA-binding MarR family transcriptional regulator n=1 Tax=Cytobacillus purgationiresistens TaxID=863449 RepID=A0ABU0AJG5_9BACI|nr:MarR family transcriptional regulator [Cytobacillus purgationiresistens]MDQ0271411.1 DNA-binding MarR family transcriptional regulator [Cytobacillus purgationiresistens]